MDKLSAETKTALFEKCKNFKNVLKESIDMTKENETKENANQAD